MEIINKELPPQPVIVSAAPTTPQTASATAAKKPMLDTFKNMSLINKILIGLAVGMIFFVIILLLLIPKGTPVSPVVTPSNLPGSTVSASLIPQQVSAFGQTENFQKFESTLDSLKADNGSLNLSEEKLSFPLLEMHVSYEK